MRKVFAVCFAIMCLLFISCSKTSLIGKYKNTIPTKNDIEFTEDNRFIMSFEGKPYMSGTYQTDTSQSPKHIAMTMDVKYKRAEDASEIIPALGVYKFEGNQLTIKIANGTNADVTYPKDFSDDPAFLIQHFVSE